MHGNELKLVYPQNSITPEDFIHLNFEQFYLQPMDSTDSTSNKENWSLAVQYCLNNPKWKLSLQTHKILGLK